MGYDIGIEEAFRRKEIMQELAEKTYWQETRVKAAIAAMQGLLANADWEGHTPQSIASDAVHLADALVEELKKEK